MDDSIAPKERVNITYKAKTDGGTEEKVIPFKAVVLGDFTGRPDTTLVRDRTRVSINKETFDNVLEKQNVELTIAVSDVLTGKEGRELPIRLAIRKMSDLRPEAIAESVPELKKLFELRAALLALKAPLGNVTEFTAAIEKCVKDPETRKKLLSEVSRIAE